MDNPNKTVDISLARGGLAPYAHLKNFLKEGLASGRWKAGTLMPSESELVRQFQVSRMTAARALRELGMEGLVTRVQGVGTYAAHLSPISAPMQIRDLHQEILERGGHHHAEVHIVQEEAAPETVARQFGLSVGAPVFHTVIVFFENGVAVQCEDRYVNPACAPDYLKVDFTRIVPTHYLTLVAPLWEATFTVKAGPPSTQEALWLDIPSTEACLIVMRRTVNREFPITWVRQVHPGTRYQLDGRFKP